MGFVATAIALASVAGAGASVYNTNKQIKESKRASEEAAQQNAAAIQTVKDTQANASTKATEAVATKQRARSGSQSIYTSPLGLGTIASTSKKTLLGQ